MYLIRLSPYPNESLLSYLNRTAAANKTSLIELLKEVKNKDYNLRTDRIYLVDIYPESVLNLDLLTKRTQLQAEGILQMTFYYAHYKFSHSEKNSDSRLMKGLIRHQAYYCPQCLFNNNYIRLYWKLSDIDICLEHRCYLVSACQNCNNRNSFQDLGYKNCCSHCNVFLGDPSYKKVEDEDHIASQQWLYNQWSILLSANSIRYTPQEVAQKIAFLIYDRKPSSILRESCENLGVDYQGLMQSARNTQGIRRSTHLSILLSFMIKLDVDLEVLLTTKPTEQFLNQYVTNEFTDYIEAVCIAPWCSSYQLKDHLVETGTNYKKLKDGGVRKKYLFCSQCGCTYFFNSAGRQIERDGFLQGFYDFEVRKLCPNTHTDILIPKAKEIKAYFQSRLPSQNKASIDINLLNRFVYAIQSNIGLNQIKKWNCWVSEDQYLMYRYHVEVLRSQQFKKRNSKKRIDYNAKLIELNKCIEEQLPKNEIITLSFLANKIGMSTGTLRLWEQGYNIYLNAKMQQNVEVLEQRKVHFKTQINEFLLSQKGRNLKSKDVYEYLRVSHSYMLSVYPEVTEHVSQSIKKYRNGNKQKKQPSS
ncbi:TniQ family protein [Paenibacillus sp. 7523-1]|uniref:TniQ family protein n=1 Tax=Paenibacillus sp. 7523-1 TaxID=2022550 RepID=UPI002681A295